MIEPVVGTLGGLVRKRKESIVGRVDLIKLFLSSFVKGQTKRDKEKEKERERLGVGAGTVVFTVNVSEANYHR